VASMIHLMVEDANFSQPYIVYSWVFLAIIFVARNQLRTGSGIAHDAWLGGPQQQVSLPRPEALNQ